MKDALSIVQHHDAVTGTAKQHVADDYNTQIANAREHQNQVYADLIDGLAQRAGIKSQDWQWCTRTNGTVSDCEFSTPFADTVVVATHNPSEQDISNVWLKVPHGHFQVQAQQSFTHDWYDVPANVFCNEQSVEFQPDKTETDCTMYVEQKVKAGQIGFTKLDEDPQSDLAACDEPSVHEISSGAFKLSLFGIENDIAQFKFSDILKDEEHNLGVSLRWYESFAERNQQRSGAYVFRPREN